MVVKALAVGGTGVVSTGIVQQLLVRGVQVSVVKRGLRPSSVGDRVRLIRGDRAEASGFVQAFEREQFDVVHDMICYTAEDAETSARRLSRPVTGERARSRASRRLYAPPRRVHSS
jgi:nucleoside-diphosphate-sugar epimerase